MKSTSSTRTEREIFEFPNGIGAFPVHPGKSIAAELAARGLSAHRAALMMRMPPNRVGLILAGRRGITPDTALRLAQLFGNSARFWVNLQAQFDLAVAERETGARIAEEVEAA
ncbi:MAG: HigA family addiction module antidote protein [Alphaproteobacteria bacterium]|nr:HigA family addiction module antidote protein [Alphaproteobacteria bacterium]